MLPSSQTDADTNPDAEHAAMQRLQLPTAVATQIPNVKSMTAYQPLTPQKQIPHQLPIIYGTRHLKRNE